MHNQMVLDHRLGQMTSQLSHLPSLGTTSAAALMEVGIADPESLRKHGSIEAFKLLRAQFGKRVTINWIYALDCAVRDIPWQLLEDTRKQELRAEAKTIIAELGNPGGIK